MNKYIYLATLSVAFVCMVGVTSYHIGKDIGKREGVTVTQLEYKKHKVHMSIAMQSLGACAYAKMLKRRSQCQ